MKTLRTLQFASSIWEDLFVLLVIRIGSSKPLGGLQSSYRRNNGIYVIGFSEKPSSLIDIRSNQQLNPEPANSILFHPHNVTDFLKCRRGRQLAHDLKFKS